MLRHRPHSKLPYVVDETHGSVCVVCANGSAMANISDTSINPGSHPAEVEDASYLSHAANAYPKLVDFVYRIANGECSLGANAIALLREIGEDQSFI